MEGLVSWLIIGLVGGWVGWLAVSPVTNLVGGPLTRLVRGLVVGLIVLWVVGPAIGLVSGLVGRPITALVFGLACGLVCGLVCGLAFGLTGGLVGGVAGGASCAARTRRLDETADQPSLRSPKAEELGAVAEALAERLEVGHVAVHGDPVAGGAREGKEERPAEAPHLDLGAHVEGLADLLIGAALKH